MHRRAVSIQHTAYSIQHNRRNTANRINVDYNKTRNARRLTSLVLQESCKVILTSPHARQPVRPSTTPQTVKGYSPKNEKKFTLKRIGHFRTPINKKEEFIGIVLI